MLTHFRAREYAQTVDRADSISRHGNKAKGPEPRTDVFALSVVMERLPDGTEQPMLDAMGEPIVRKEMLSALGKVKLVEGSALGVVGANPTHPMFLSAFRHWQRAGCPPHEWFSPTAFRKAGYDQRNLRKPTAVVCPACGYVRCMCKGEAK